MFEVVPDGSGSKFLCRDQNGSHIGQVVINLSATPICEIWSGPEMYQVNLVSFAKNLFKLEKDGHEIARAKQEGFLLPTTLRFEVTGTQHIIKRGFWGLKYQYFGPSEQKSQGAVWCSGLFKWKVKIPDSVEIPIQIFMYYMVARRWA